MYYVFFLLILQELADNSASLVSIINFHVKAFIIRGRQKRIKELLDQMDLETFKPQNKEEEKYNSYTIIRSDLIIHFS